MTAEYVDESTVGTSPAGDRVPDLRHELARSVRMLHRMKVQLVDRLPRDLDPAAAQLLTWLVRQGPSRQADLAGATFLDPSTVSRRISQLVQAGLVERVADQRDGRAVTIVPSDEGRQLCGALRADHEAVLRGVVQDWSPADLETLVVLLRALNDDFEAYRCEPGTTASRT